MKIVVPVCEDRGAESRIFHHFGSAPVWLVVDTVSGEITNLPRPASQESQQGCGSVEQLVERGVDAVITGGIGPRALERLEAADILVFEPSGETVRESLEALRTRGLSQWRPGGKGCCEGHAGGGHGGAWPCTP